MRRVKIQGTEIAPSRLSFGTASLHHLASSNRRQDVLAAALDNGFTHFDTAPSYGFGLAEIELGRFLKTRRVKVTVATKIGLYPPNAGDPRTASVWARKLTGKLVPALSRPSADWSIGAIARGFEVSLRRLNTDVADLLLLHEPVDTELHSDVLVDWLERQRDKGRIRAWGLAGRAECMQAWLTGNHALAMVLQVRDSLDRKEADLVTAHGRELQFTYGYLSSSSRIQSRPSATEVLDLALSRNPTGSVLVSTRHLARVSQLAAVAKKRNGVTN